MSDKTKKSIVIHNIKSSGFRQIHVDGAHGGITPNGMINVNFFSHRNAIPRGTEFELNENGSLGEIIKDIDDSKTGVVREFEIGTYMDLNTCINLRDFLDKKIEEYKSYSELLKNK